MSSNFFFRVAVNVSSGAGSTVFWNEVDPAPQGFFGGLSADLLGVSVKVPTDTPTYGWIISDEDGFVVAGRNGLVGGAATSETAPIYPRGSVQIVGATVDGVYLFKIYAKQVE